MEKFTADGKELKKGQAFQVNGNSYPANWLELATAQDLKKHKIKKEVVPDPEPSATLNVYHVEAERQRRLGLGFDYDFGDARGVHRIGTTEADLRGWGEVTNMATALSALGDTETDIQIVTDTGPCKVKAQEWMAILLAAAQARQPIWAASFALAAQDPIPATYKDDQHWGA